MGFGICRPTRRDRGGFTLIEGLLASVVLAAAVIAVCAALAASLEHEEVARERAVAASLARQLMEEISAKPFVDPVDHLPKLGPGPGQTSRSDFTSVGNYHGYSDVSSGIRTLGGTTIQAGGGGTYSRSVSVEYRLTPAGSSAAVGDFALVTVSVEGPSGQAVRPQQLMANVRYE